MCNKFQYPVPSLLNVSFSRVIRPNRLKQFQVTSLYKRKDSLYEEIYRLVSILLTTLNVHERVIHEPLSEYLDDMFNPFLSSFRIGYGYQTTVLRLLEDWQSALDKHECVAAVFMDLS